MQAFGKLGLQEGKNDLTTHHSQELQYSSVLLLCYIKKDLNFYVTATDIFRELL